MNNITHIHTHNVYAWYYMPTHSLVPRPSLDLPTFNVTCKKWEEALFASNIKSWEIERGPGDEAEATRTHAHTCMQQHTHMYIYTHSHLQYLGMIGIQHDMEFLSISFLAQK